MEQTSFAQKVASTLNAIAPIYKQKLIDYEYLIYSSGLKERFYYIISSSEDNFMHLTGLRHRDPNKFFSKCLTAGMQESDIIIPNTSIKGSVRRKIAALPSLVCLFDSPCFIQENLSKNKVVCSFASSNNVVTIGFCSPNEENVVKPMSLLTGTELDASLPLHSEIILKRKKGDKLFNTIIQGTKEDIEKANLSKLVDFNNLKHD